MVFLARCARSGSVRAVWSVLLAWSFQYTGSFSHSSAYQNKHDALNNFSFTEIALVWGSNSTANLPWQDLSHPNTSSWGSRFSPHTYMRNTHEPERGHHYLSTHRALTLAVWTIGALCLTHGLSAAAGVQEEEGQKEQHPGGPAINQTHPETRRNGETSVHLDAGKECLQQTSSPCFLNPGCVSRRGPRQLIGSCWRCGTTQGQEAPRPLSQIRPFCFRRLPFLVSFLPFLFPALL